ncbi:methionyl-tRNA formyltransferase, putative [Plasmodium knowlesi strain H]|uniref:Methionyl-tRNA formyltransferase, putative n=3 Tax=Plasmodium knowlesi TaxID=5850 RepID=A0A5K1V9M4_PLAKH|nr:methionyl-tRNA formyltransferase, putative [Plasmodium knowlesi strain H]OTN64291.1 putative Methionyl-tRNA formyltransferase [Plasmodium knowlesi]CAA9990738.1 methionyl-tRNA formyltransferase, putative [Plasmodium knowlesi strain H]SBO21184.1 methionyl-tRNA formyltransferase, putative [Plasmodium knowlesi strain H]SBO21638.1 methionyl-tRNA formyltransferase, putative [Plasmodium knowlesi strain H]VVS80212.1 methionyl-tRNA formyltransferase, putative [Plasmodium knowlesi strain H]|eukprot:XP_002262027.1 methionyl-tRNA formyltransferase, putative [Plasmodium knowlesi strain H]
MNITSYHVQIFFVIFLKICTCKLCYINKVYVGKEGQPPQKISQSVHQISAKNVKASGTKERNQDKLNLTKLNGASGLSPSWGSCEALDGGRAFSEETHKVSCNLLSILSSRDHGHGFHSGKEETVIHLTNALIGPKRFLNKYSFFKNNHEDYQPHPSEGRTHKRPTQLFQWTNIPLHNVLLHNVFQNEVVNLHLHNVYLEIIRTAQSTLRSKIFYVDIKEELRKRKNTIMDMLHQIYALEYKRNTQRSDRIRDKDKTKIRILFIGGNEFSLLCFKVIRLIIKYVRNDIVLDHVITKSPRKKGRHLKLKKSHIEEEAEKEKIKIFYYDKIRNDTYMLKNETFDLCISASFGEIFNASFFKNIASNVYTLHPSLLPLYRGASPIQRSLLNNESLFGYSIFLTNLRIDAGPVLIRSPHTFGDAFNFNDIITILFTLGSLHLMRHIFFLANYKLGSTNGELQRTVESPNPSTISTHNNNKHLKIRHLLYDEENITPHNVKKKQFMLHTDIGQDKMNYAWLRNYLMLSSTHNNNTYAPKIKSEERYVCFFCSTALHIHNKVRGFINWPKVECTLYLVHKGGLKAMEVKLIKTSQESGDHISHQHLHQFKHLDALQSHKCFDGIPRKLAIFNRGAINILCKDNSLLKIYKLQRKNKKIMDASSFFNSINGVDLLY